MHIHPNASFTPQSNFGPILFRMHVNRLDNEHRMPALRGFRAATPRRSCAARLKWKQVLFFHAFRTPYNAVSMGFKGKLGQPIRARDSFWCDHTGVTEHAQWINSYGYNTISMSMRPFFHSITVSLSLQNHSSPIEWMDSSCQPIQCKIIGASV